MTDAASCASHSQFAGNSEAVEDGCAVFPGGEQQRSATLTGRARAWQNGVFGVNDPDCLIVGPQAERREQWAAHIARYGGLLCSSDRLSSPDAWGLEVTRRLLAEARHPRQTAQPAGK